MAQELWWAFAAVAVACLWLAGYLAGVLVAEYRWARPWTGVVRSAALVPPLAWGPLAAPVPVRGLVVGGRGDALHSTSVHAVAGAGLAIVLLSLSVQVGLVAANLGGGPGRTTVVALPWACAAAAPAAWIRVGHPSRWAVRRVVTRDAGGPGRA